jgi:uncharacterized protein YggE
MSRFALILCLIPFAAASADEKLSPRHVSVTGTAVSRVQPDIVVWSVNVRRTHRDLAQAQASCDEGVKKILAIKNDLKLKPEDVQTGYLSIQKIYDRDQYGNQTSFKHFEVVRTVTLRQKDTTKFDEVLTKLIDAADVGVSYHLESSEYLNIRTTTRLRAVTAAREKAQAMTELLGAKLGRALVIEEPKESWGRSAINNYNNSVAVEGRNAEPDTAPGTFAPGSIEVRVSIDVTFEIE